MAADTGADADGWFDEENWELADVSIQAGDSVLVNTVSGNVAISLMGEVAQNDYVKKSVEGFNWSGNVTPVAINIQSIQLSGDGIDPAGGDNIQFLDAGGKTVASYGWLLAADTGADADGWFDEENWELADVSLAPGAGVLVNTVSSDVVITVDSAL